MAEMPEAQRRNLGEDEIVGRYSVAELPGNKRYYKNHNKDSHYDQGCFCPAFVACNLFPFPLLAARLHGLQEVFLVIVR